MEVVERKKVHICGCPGGRLELNGEGLGKCCRAGDHCSACDVAVDSDWHECSGCQSGNRSGTQHQSEDPGPTRSVIAQALL